MLTCKEISQRVTTYMERDLSWKEWLDFTLHLALCAVCRRYVAQMRTTKAVLGRLGQTHALDARMDPSLREAFRAWRDATDPPSPSDDTTRHDAP